MAANRKYIRKTGWLLVLYGGLLVFLFSTNPRNLPIGFLILPFIWLFVAFFFTILFTMQVFNLSSRSPQDIKKLYIIAAVAAALPTCALLLDSIGQLTLRDGLLIGVAGLLGLFYAAKTNFRSSNF